jgi:hypothetical protein
LDFLPGWQALVHYNLHTRYVNGHHRELMTPQNVRSMAEIILSHLTPAEKEVATIAVESSLRQPLPGRGEVTVGLV